MQPPSDQPNRYTSDLASNLSEIILSLCEARGADKSICPSEAARAAAASLGLPWRQLLPDIRAVAEILQKDDKIRVLQQGHDVDLQNAKGPIRLALLKR